MILNFSFQIESHVNTAKDSDLSIVRCYGITKDPETNNFMMVMEYAQCGSLRQHLNNSFNSLNWDNKIYNLICIAAGLRAIHKKGLIHQDLHSGNVLNNKRANPLYSLITDLGFCKPANVEPSQNNGKQIYGVLQF